MILWFYGIFSSTTSKAFQKSAFPQHFLKSLGVIVSGAVGAGSRGKPDTLCAALPIGPLQDTSAQVSHGDVSFWVCHWGCAPPLQNKHLELFFGDIGTNPWAVELWVTSFLCQTIRWASELGVFLHGEYFTVASCSPWCCQEKTKNHSSFHKSPLHLCSHCSGLWLEGEKWVACCR